MVRTRFAPSPSGFLHVGGARTALFNYLYAKARGGQFLIRVEDTDRERSSPESERIILDSLKWLGIHADEGPDEGGDFGPYRQSERLDIYAKYTNELLESGKAYRCFCTPEELEARQKAAREAGENYVYDGTYRDLDPEESARRAEAGEKFTVRLRVEEGEIQVKDIIQGKVKFDTRIIGDFILVKSDGYPAYNYAVVVDDLEMKISHVVRGVGHLSNTPRQILVHRALGIDPPEYAHISEIVGTDRKKLSKRRGATSVLFFQELGYLSESFVNYMSLLGWYPEDGVEFMPDGQLAQKFDLERCSKSPSMFDFFLVEKEGNERGGKKKDKQGKQKGKGQNAPAETAAEDAPTEAGAEALSLDELRKIVNKKSKLNFLNNRFIRHLPLERVWSEARASVTQDATLAALVAKDEDRVRATFDAVRVYLDTLEEATPYLLEILQEEVRVEDDARAFLSDLDPNPLWDAFAELLAEEKPADPDAFSAAIKTAGERAEAKGKQLFMPVRIGTTGRMHGLELPRLFTLLGYEEVLRRLERVRAALA